MNSSKSINCNFLIGRVFSPCTQARSCNYKLQMRFASKNQLLAGKNSTLPIILQVLLPSTFNEWSKPSSFRTLFLRPKYRRLKRWKMGDSTGMLNFLWWFWIFWWNIFIQSFLAVPFEEKRTESGWYICEGNIGYCTVLFQNHITLKSPKHGALFSKKL